jgi:lipoyl(octanoyl) transferase
MKANLLRHIARVTSPASHPPRHIARAANPSSQHPLHAPDTQTDCIVTSGLWSGTVILLRSTAQDAVTNMALDEAMLHWAAASNATVVRTYLWSEPSVSFGANQRCAHVYSAERCAALGVPAVRRLTGGRALLHAREVTYAVAAPVSKAPTLRGGYAEINAVLGVALGSLGVLVEGAPSGGVRLGSPGLAPCFEMPAAGELTVQGRKLVGSAQHRDARALLQHGSILLDNDQPRLRDLALQPLPHTPEPATLRALLGPSITTSMVQDALIAAVRAAVRDATRGAATGTLAEYSDSVVPTPYLDTATRRYRDPHWTWRR